MSIPVKFASWLRKLPGLREIGYTSRRDSHGGVVSVGDLDPTEAAVEVTGHIYSVCHGGEELLYGDMLVQDIHQWESRNPQETCPTRVFYTGAPAETFNRLPHLARVDEPTWCPFGDYRGESIVHAAIRGIEEIEGVKGSGYWERRGVEVGLGAWNLMRRQRSIMLGIEQVSMEADSYLTDVELIR